MDRLTHSLLLIDDHPIIHTALKTLLASEKSLSVQASATSATEAMEILTTMHPDLIIIDLSLGDSDGSYLIQKIHNRYPRIRILVYTMSEERLFGERVASAGACGYVMKTSKPSILKKAIYAILDGDLFFSNETQSRLLKRQAGRPVAPQSDLDHLSNREMDVFRLVGEGLNSLHISDKLNISKNTVDTHRINIRKKLDLPNGKALDRLAYEVILQGKPPDIEGG